VLGAEAFEPLHELKVVLVFASGQALQFHRLRNVQFVESRLQNFVVGSVLTSNRDKK
jgi:hypothetical protein